MIRGASLFASAVLLSGVHVSAWAADVKHGEDLAARWCTGCHLVTPEQKQASADVPTFSAIARMPNFSVEKLVFFLLEPHPKMPNLPLSRTEAQDLAAYIATRAK